MFDQTIVLPIILQVVEVFVSLVGVAMLISAVVNLLKLTEIVTDGTAPNWTAALNLVAFVIIVAWRLLQPSAEIAAIDGYFKSVAVIVGFVITYLVQIKSSTFAHNVLKTVPAFRWNIGYSFKAQKIISNTFKGQGMVEYALILVLVAVVVIAALSIMGPLVANIFETINASL
jgi:pilus assembly protein Flp/PilA